MSVYRLTLLAILAALGVVGRSLFVFLPNVQPVTAIIIICGIILGPISAFVLSILITFLSNMLLGMGIWTVWQIISWGLIRSEEHTSELQSRGHLVCRLLLEIK